MQPYFATHSGKMINIETFSEDDICLEDIAHHLSSIKRYGGAQSFETNYTVAQHSYLLAWHAFEQEYDSDIARYILLHDASEAYLGDVVSNLKGYLLDYARIESKFQSVILSKYGIFPNTIDLKYAHELDKRILIDEVQVLFPEELQSLYLNGVDLSKKLNVEIDVNRSPYKDKATFLGWCELLNIKD